MDGPLMKTEQKNKKVFFEHLNYKQQLQIKVRREGREEVMTTPEPPPPRKFLKTDGFLHEKPKKTFMDLPRLPTRDDVLYFTITIIF